MTGIRELEIVDIPTPAIRGGTDVLLKVKAVGICGSDLHYYLSGRIGDQVVRYPFTAGHECAAVVEEAGGDCVRIRPGDEVFVDPAVVCGSCDQCISGRSHTCRQLRFLGCPGQLKGCLSDYIVLPEENCLCVPAEMTPSQRVLVEPLSIGLYSYKFIEKRQAQSIAILGSGPIGLSTALVARCFGVKKTYMTDKIENRLDAAREAGAVWVGNPEKGDIVQAILGREQYGLDAVFECCGDQEALDQAVTLLRPGGDLMVVGIPETDSVSFDIHTMRRKEIRIQNVRRQNRCLHEAIELIARKRIDVDFLATHDFSLVEAKRAFELVAGYKDGVLKAVIHIDR